MKKRLFRSRNDRVLWGVCGGLGEYFNMDPVLVRIIFVLLVFANGIGILAYIIMAIVVPLEGSAAGAPRETIKENVRDMKQSAEEIGKEIRSGLSGESQPKAEQPTKESVLGDSKRGGNGLRVAGIVLVVLGVVFLLTSLRVFNWFWWFNFWPVILIIVGILVIVGVRRK